jgi:IPT/TIG domain
LSRFNRGKQSFPRWLRSPAIASGAILIAVAFAVSAAIAAGAPGLAWARGPFAPTTPKAPNVTPTVTLSASTGAPGKGLTVNGSGWPAGNTIFVQIGSTTFNTDDVCELTASSDGLITGNQPNGNCQVPNVPAGSRTLFAIDEQSMGTNVTGTSFTVTPVLVVTPANSSAGSPASPGATATIQGHGFAATSTVSGFKFNGSAVATSPTSIGTDANGNFTSSVTLTSLPSIAAGTYPVTAQDTAPNVGSASLKVYAPTVTFSPTSGVAGHALTVSGFGWPAGDLVFVQIGSSSFGTDVACELSVGSDGTIAGNQAGNNCAVPNVPKGSEPVVAIDDQQRGVIATGTYAVSPALVLTPANASAGAPSSPGTTVTIQGHGFAANSTVSGFKFDGSALATIPSSISTDSNGNFTGPVQFTLPSATASTHTVSAQDTVPNTGSASIKVYVPTLFFSPNSGTAGHALKVSGFGWPAGDLVFVQIGSSSFGTDIACELNVGSDGTIGGNQAGNNCMVPNVPKGSEPVAAIDDQQRAVVATGSYSVSPVLVLTPANSSAGSPASPGTTVTIQGHGFAANSTVSGFKFNGSAVATIPASIGTDSNGNFTSSVSFSVPSIAAGTYTVSAQDLVPNTGSTTLKIYVPHITVSPVSGAAGRGLKVSGFGWVPGDLIFVQIGSPNFGTDVTCELTAASDGTITGDQPNGGCQVPSIGAGSQPVVAIDDQNRGVLVNGTAFTVS